MKTTKKPSVKMSVGGTKPKAIKSMKKMSAGGESDCTAGDPGCGHRKAQRKNARRRFWNSDAGQTIKKVGIGIGAAGAAVGAYAKNAFGVKDKVNELMGHKKGGPVKRKTGGAIKKKK